MGVDSFFLFKEADHWYGTCIHSIHGDKNTIPTQDERGTPFNKTSNHYEKEFPGNRYIIKCLENNQDNIWKTPTF